MPPRSARLRSYIPIVDVVASYRRRDFAADAVAAIVLGMLTIPQAVAYAMLAGLPPVSGLYASAWPMLAYALLGSSRELVVGPVAVSAIMVAGAIHAHADNPDAYLAVATTLSLECGLLLWLLRATAMGGIVNLLSSPVVAGFVNAAGVLIILSQLPALFGIAPIEGHPFAQAYGVLREIEHPNVVATALGVGALALVALVRRFGYYAVLPFLRRVGRQHPVTRTGPIVAMIVSIAVVASFSLDAQHGVAVMGAIPHGLPPFTWPIFEIRLWIALLPSAAMVALVTYVSSYSIATSLADRKHRAVNGNQELVALGAANVVAAFTGAYPVAGSFSRSSVNVAAGARTPMSAVFSMLVIVAALLWFADAFGKLPRAVLAAIIIGSVIDMIDLRPIVRNFRFYRYDSYTHLATFAAVLLFSVETGLLAGMLVAVALFVRSSSRPHLAVVGRVGDTTHFRNRKNHDVRTYPGIVAVRIDENVYFANANDIERRVLKILDRETDPRHLLLVCSAINFVDTSGLEMLIRLNRKLSRDGMRLHLADVKVPVMNQLRATPLLQLLTGRVFFTTDEAMRALAAIAPEQPQEA